METLLTGYTGVHPATGEQNEAKVKMREAAGEQDTVNWTGQETEACLTNC